MNRAQFVVIPAAILAVLFADRPQAAVTFRVSEDKLATVELPVPKDEGARKYLGVSGRDTFRLSDINAQTVILEIFSMYCPICQAEAPNVNRIYRSIRNDPRLTGTVKVIGVGTGNTPFEVEVFRKKYEIPFPLFPDDNFLIQKVSQDPIRTPTFLILKMEKGQKPRVHKVHVGRIDNASDFVKSLPDSSRKK